jgi:predicted nucleic acid-binding protein
MPGRFGIDTSALVRLVTGDPEAGFTHCVRNLSKLVDGEGAEILASNQVIGEAYIALQHHYGVTKSEARSALGKVLRSGLVSPMNGPAILALLEARTGSGLLDRLIADDYARHEVVTLTLDRKMAALPRCRLL